MAQYSWGQPNLGAVLPKPKKKYPSPLGGGGTLFPQLSDISNVPAVKQQQAISSVMKGVPTPWMNAQSTAGWEKRTEIPQSQWWQYGGGPPRDPGINEYTEGVLAKHDPYAAQHAAQPNLAIPPMQPPQLTPEEQMAETMREALGLRKAAGTAARFGSPFGTLSSFQDQNAGMSQADMGDKHMDRAMLSRLYASNSDPVGTAATWPGAWDSRPRYDPGQTDPDTPRPPTPAGYRRAPARSTTEMVRGALSGGVGPGGYDASPGGVGDDGPATIDTNLFGPHMALNTPAGQRAAHAQQQAMVTANAQNRADVRGAQAGRLPWGDVRQRMTPAEADFQVNKPTDAASWAAAGQNPLMAPESQQFGVDAFRGKMALGVSRERRRWEAHQMANNPGMTPEALKEEGDAIFGPEDGADNGPAYPPNSPMAMTQNWTSSDRAEYFNPNTTPARKNEIAAQYASPTTPSPLTIPNASSGGIASWMQEHPGLSAAGAIPAAYGIGRLIKPATTEGAVPFSRKLGQGTRALGKGASKMMPWLKGAAKVAGPIGLVMAMNDMAQAAGTGSEIRPWGMDKVDAKVSAELAQKGYPRRKGETAQQHVDRLANEGITSDIDQPAWGY